MLNFNRTATARGKAEQADEAADQAKEDCDIAQTTAKQFAPDFKHPGFDRIGLREKYRQKVYEQQVNPIPPTQETEKIMDSKSIPNHIPPMHSHIPQMNKVPNAVSSRRPSTQYHNTGQSMDQRYPNNPNYITDDRNVNPPYDQFYKTNQDSWTGPGSLQSQTQNQKLYSNNPPSGYMPENQPPHSPYLTQQQALDSNQQYANQNRRFSSSIRPSTTQRPSQDWNAPPGISRRQSILAQPTNDPQSETYMDSSMAAYRRNELRTGTVHSEGALDRQAQNVDTQGYQQSMSSQVNRQPMDTQMHRQGAEQQMYRQTSVNQPGYRQTPDKQLYRQQAMDQHSYQPPAATDQDIMNGDRDLRQQGPRPSIDYFDHYKRPPSRDSSVDRYGRRSRQPSVEAVPPSGGSRAGSVAPQPITTSRPPSRAATPAGNGHLASGRGSISRASSREHQPFEDSLLRKRNLGQEISPSPYQPKRTESLYVAQNSTPPPPAPTGGGGGGRKVSIHFF